MALVCKAIQFSSVSFIKTSSAHCILHPSPQSLPPSPFSHPLPTFTYSPSPFPLNATTLLSVSMYYVLIYFLVNPFTFFFPMPPNSIVSDSCLFHVSMPLFLCCSSVYFILFFIRSAIIVLWHHLLLPGLAEICYHCASQSAEPFLSKHSVTCLSDSCRLCHGKKVSWRLSALCSLSILAYHFHDSVGISFNVDHCFF